jgi:hypothetical protein
LPPPPLPPEPGTPAYTAVADQYAAAQDQTTSLGSALLRVGALLLPPTGVWARAMLDSVAPVLGVPGARVVCPHIAHAPGPQPMFVLVAGTLSCHDCLQAVRIRPPRPECGRCGRSGLALLREVIAQRHIVIARGRLCPACLYAERFRPHSSPTPDSSTGGISP